MKHPPKPFLIEFNLPEVRTLADMTPEERAKIARELGAPLTHYDSMGRARPCNCACKFRGQPCPWHGEDRFSGIDRGISEPLDSTAGPVTVKALRDAADDLRSACAWGHE